MPRLLGPAEFGRMTVALAIVTVGAVAISLGAPSAFARFVPASAAMIPVLAMLPLLPLQAIGAQSFSLRLRPGMTLGIDAAGLVAFVAAALVLVPRWGAAGATGALLTAIITSAVLSSRAIPAVVTARLLSTGLVASAAVLTLAAALRRW